MLTFTTERPQDVKLLLRPLDMPWEAPQRIPNKEAMSDIPVVFTNGFGPPKIPQGCSRFVERPLTEDEINVLNAVRWARREGLLEDS
jgi:hypothetical protein